MEANLLQNYLFSFHVAVGGNEIPNQFLDCRNYLFNIRTKVHNGKTYGVSCEVILYHPSCNIKVKSGDRYCRDRYI